MTSYITYGTAAILGTNIAVYAFKYAWLALKTPFSATNAALTLMKTNLTATNIQTGISTARTYAMSAASWVSTGAQWAWNTAMSVGRGLLGVGRLALYYGALAVGQGVTATITAAQWAWNMAMMANPIGLVIAGVIALVGVGVWMYNNWEEITNFISLMWNDPGAAIDMFVDGFKDKFSGAFNWLSEKWNWIKGLFSEPIEANVQASASANSMYQRFSYANVAANANGGIYGKGAFLTTFAGAEAAIPLDGSPRAIGLWQQADKL